MNQSLQIPDMQRTQPLVTEVTPDTIKHIQGRVLAFRRFSSRIEEKQQDGEELSPVEVKIFMQMSKTIASEDSELLLGVIDSLVYDSEQMAALLHSVAAAKPDDFDDVQTRVLMYLSNFRFAS